MPFSPTLLFEPDRRVEPEPSTLAMTLLVQWWLIGPAGGAILGVGAASMRVAPATYAGHDGVGVGDEVAADQRHPERRARCSRKTRASPRCRRADARRAGA
jgi:hypothetical protein